MTDALRRMHRRIAAAEAEISQVLRQWPDDARSLEPYPSDSMVLGPKGAVLRRVAADLYLLTVAENTLGMLIFLATPCKSGVADGVEMTPSNCNSDSILQNAATPSPISSRALVFSL